MHSTDFHISAELKASEETTTHLRPFFFFSPPADPHGIAHRHSRSAGRRPVKEPEEAATFPPRGPADSSPPPPFKSERGETDESSKGGTTAPPHLSRLLCHPPRRKI